MLPILEKIFNEWAWMTPLLAALAITMSIATVMAVLLDRRSRSQSAMSWVLLVIVAPFVGPIVYIFFGRAWLSGKRSRAYARVAQERAEIRRRDEASGQAADRAKARERVQSVLAIDQRRLAVQAASISGDFPVGGNDIEIFDEADELFERLAADIDRAERHVHVEFYIALDDATSGRVFAALERAAKRGIPCRVLLDGLGSRGFLKSTRHRDLLAAGVQVVEALPVGFLRRRFGRIDLRNHRKIVVIDGAIGYIGSHNLAAKDFKVKEKYAPWIDATMRVRGPVANDLQKIFLEDWFLETDEELVSLVALGVRDGIEPAIAQVLGTGPATYESAMPQLILSLVHLAEEEVVLTTPYFVPDEPALASLLTAARRGVRTVLVVPEHNDSALVKLASRKFYQRLLEAGVEIWQYRGGLLHAKTIVVDGRTCLMSSANLDRRSFELNLEASLVVYDASVSRSLRALQGTYLERSTRIVASEWYARPWWTRLVENAVGLMSPLL
ncbi:MAG: cardiolipin synthase [Planctomycetaceae bacterium]|nr:cardiolipin synthase [Planctomycetaceae bacterium]